MSDNESLCESRAINCPAYVKSQFDENTQDYLDLQNTSVSVIFVLSQSVKRMGLPFQFACWNLVNCEAIIM